jgi:hypothetical protein
MKAMRPAAAIAKILLASQLVLLLAGCGNFWEAPGGSSSGGTTASTTTLTASASSVSAGTSVTLTATVSPTAATGTVNFLSSGSSIGTGTLSSGTATDSYTFATAGSYSVTANYEGNSTYASSTSSATTISVTAASAGSSQPGLFGAADAAARATNLVLDPANTWTVPAKIYLRNVAGVVLSNGMVENIDGDGHCIYYSGKVYIAAGAQSSSTPAESTAIYELSGGGYLAPEGTADLDCE